MENKWHFNAPGVVAIIYKNNHSCIVDCRALIIYNSRVGRNNMLTKTSSQSHVVLGVP